MSKDKREQVFQACQELLKEEKSVTVRAVAVIDRSYFRSSLLYKIISYPPSLS